MDARRAVQLHDATVLDLRVGAGGRVVLRLAEATVYQPVAPESYGIWIHDADLIVSGVTETSVQGRWTEEDDDYILDATILNERGEEISWMEMETGELSSIRLFLFSGASIDIKGSRVEVRLSEKREASGRWVGPLRGGRREPG
jgi:hypothetical protein